MDTLKNKRYLKYGYTCRQNGTAVYYDTLTGKECYGIIRDLNKTTASFTHIVQERETLDSLALKYYNNPTYWWVIAMFNNIQDALVSNLKEEYPVLQIPNIAAIIFEKEKR